MTPAECPRYGGVTGQAENDHERRGCMATAEECRKALESLTGRISDMDAKDRAAHLVDRTLSCRVPDLGLTFVTRLGPDGAEPIREADNDTPQAQVRFTADSDVVVAIAGDPGSFMRAWLSGKLKVQGSVFDLLHLRKLM
jgi:predicted lipid carrier protein YhbT